MGVNGAHNTVEENIGVYNTVCVRAVAEYCSRRRTWYGPWYRGLTCAPCLAFFVRSLVFSEQASRSVSPNRLWLRQSEQSSEQGLCIPRSETWGSESEVVFCQAIRSERPSEGVLETEASAPIEEVGRSRKAGAVPRWPDLPVGDWIALLAYHSDTWAGP